MKIIDLIGQDRVSFSFEFIPPVKGISSRDLIQKISPLMEFKPSFVDVTCHRNEIVFDSTPLSKGSYARGLVHKKHPSILAVCESIRCNFDVEVMPHILCGGYTKAETEDLLLDLNFLGYDNVMALRGDKLSIEREFVNYGGNGSAKELIAQIKNLNNGHSLDSTVQSVKTDFCIGAACYPEKHIQSPNMQWEKRETLEKISIGADFLITQMFFNNSKYWDFLICLGSGVCKDRIIPGIKVLTSPKQVNLIPPRFGVDISQDLVVGLNGSDPKGFGIEWAVNQCKGLIRDGVKHLHFFTMNSSTVCEVLKEIL